MSSSYWVITISLFLLSAITRALPFIMRGLITERVNRLGKLLPAYIMMLLVVYEFDPKNMISPPYGMPAFLALAAVLLIHLWLRNTFVSLIVGTTAYILALSFI